jgi:hypothetical protein
VKVQGPHPFRGDKETVRFVHIKPFMPIITFTPAHIIAAPLSSGLLIHYIVMPVHEFCDRITRY